jgi:radical SAM protein with 4Fe4S-binding SPASM domain
MIDVCAQNAGLGNGALMQLIGAKAEQQRIPLNMHLELTYRCNEQCVHCYCVVEHGKEAAARQREMTTAEWTGVLDDLAALGGLYVTFSGGEVFVRADFFDIVEHARARGFVYRIYTNGIGLTEKRVQRLAELDPLTVELSIFSADPAIHDAITRVPGSFQRLLRGVRQLKDAGLRVYLKTVVMKPNVAGLADLRKLGQELAVFTHIFSCEVSPRIDGDPHRPTAYQLSEEELYEYLAHDTWRKQLAALPAGSPEDVAHQRQSCGPAINGGCIDPYGNLFPCIAFRVPLGNVRERSFRDVWYAPPPAIRDLMAIQTYADLPECRSCELNGFCNRCHGDNQLQRGDDWKACHPRARKVASAERRLYQVLAKEGMTRHG